MKETRTDMATTATTMTVTASDIDRALLGQMLEKALQAQRTAHAAYQEADAIAAEALCQTHKADALVCALTNAIKNYPPSPATEPATNGVHDAGTSTRYDRPF